MRGVADARQSEEPTVLRVLLTVIALATTICGWERQKKPVEVSEERSHGMTISISSPAFQEGGMIPPEYTCDGSDTD
jgi:hypothetical protein